MDDERHMNRINHDVELKTASLTTMREKLEEARVIDELNTDKLSNIHVFQPATFQERPVSPQKRLLAVGFLVFVTKEFSSWR